MTIGREIDATLDRLEDGQYIVILRIHKQGRRLWRRSKNAILPAPSAPRRNAGRRSRALKSIRVAASS